MKDNLSRMHSEQAGVAEEELMSSGRKLRLFGACLHGSNVITEEPGAVIPHAGICVGTLG